MAGSLSPREFVLPRRRWLRHLLFLLVGIFVYRFLLWAVVGILYDEEKVQRLLEKWAHTNLTADIDTAKVTIGINTLAMVKINIHGLSIASPNPLFPRNMLQSDPVSFFCPLWGLCGFPCQPHIEFTSPLLYCEWGTPDRGCSLNGLADYRHSGVIPLPFPLRGLRPPTVSVAIKNGKIILQRAAPAATLEISLESRNFICDLRKAKVHGSMQPSEIVLRLGDEAEPRRAHAHIDRFTLRPAQGKAGFPLVFSELRIKTAGLPLRCLGVFWPWLPPFGSGDRFSGAVCLENDHIEISGDIASDLNPILGLEPTSALSTHYLLDSKSDNLSLVFGHNAAATVAVEGHNGKWPALVTLRCHRLDLRRLPMASALAGAAWLRWMGSHDSRLAIRADIFSTRLFEMREVQVDALLGEEGCRSLIAQGRLAGGACRLQAASLPFDGNLPAKFACELVGADAAECLTALMPWLPPPMQMKARAGHVNLAVRRNAVKKPEDSPLAISCHFAALAISQDDAGDMWRDLFALPAQLASAEALIYKARSLPVPEKKKNILATLRFSELAILVAAEEDGSGTFEIHGRSPELGRLDGLGRREANGALRGAITLREVPAETVAMAELGGDTLQALVRQMEEGLCLRFSLEGGEASIERRYVQDIFRIWAEQAGSDEKELLP